MKCANCGADIPEGMLICPDCRTEVQIVPDYNPLEDVLAREVRGSVEDATRPLHPEDVQKYRSRLGREAGNATRVLSQGELEDIRVKRSARPGNQTEVWRQGNGASRTRVINGVRQNTGNVKRNTGAVRSNPGEPRRDADERRRQQMMKKKRALKKRRRAVLSVMLLFLAILGAGGFVIYQNSYKGIVNKGYRALQTGDYGAAEKSFQRAIGKDVKKADAYTGMAQIYIEQKNEEKGEDIFLKAIDSQPTNAALYQAAIDFYMKTKQNDKISGLLDGCDESVLKTVSEYVSEAPVFSLEEGSYPEVQEVALSGKGTIYYTTDDTEPTKSSTKYEEPILLDEGTTTIRAVAYNKKGLPSLIASGTYTIEIPIEDAPAVTPSTGQYTVPTQITIQVPEGYKAYYTTDGTTPSAGSQLYTGPIDMPEGTTMFSAVLINDSGKMTQVTKRNYLLEPESE